MTDLLKTITAQKIQQALYQLEPYRHECNEKALILSALIEVIEGGKFKKAHKNFCEAVKELALSKGVRRLSVRADTPDSDSDRKLVIVYDTKTWNDQYHDDTDLFRYHVDTFDVAINRELDDFTRTLAAAKHLHNNYTKELGHYENDIARLSILAAHYNSLQQRILNEIAEMEKPLSSVGKKLLPLLA